MSSRDPTIVMDPYEPLNVARNVNLESFTTIIGVLRETREALFSPLKTPSIGDIGQKVSDEERNVARQLKKREDRQMKAAVNARSNKVSQQAAAAKTQKYSKKMDKQEEANVKLELAIGVPCVSYSRTGRATLPYRAGSCYRIYGDHTQSVP